MSFPYMKWLNKRKKKRKKEKKRRDHLLRKTVFPRKDKG